MVRSAATPRVSNHQARRVPDCGSVQLENALVFSDQLAISLTLRTERILAWKGCDDFQQVPGTLGFGGLLHFHQIHRMDFAAVAPDVSLAEQGIIRRQRFHCGDDRSAVGSRSNLVDGLQVMKHGGVHTGLHVVWNVMLRVPFDEPFRERARSFIEVPVEWIQELGALRHVERQRGDAVDAQDQADDFLGFCQAEFSRLLDRDGRVVSGVGESDDLRPRCACSRKDA
jgi:hypothetical protein